MLADWSSIITGFVIVWAVIFLYAASIFWRVHKLGKEETGRVTTTGTTT